MLKYIRVFFAYAVEAGLLNRNPTPTLHFRLGGKIKQVLTQNQAKMFLEKAYQYNHDWYPIWFTALYTGMRNGELYDLTWDKIDFEKGQILVSSSWNRVDGHKDLTKSGEDRIIDIAPPLMALLRELKIKCDGCPFVLPRILTWEAGRQAEILATFLMSIGMQRVRFHDLRATWCTMLLSNGYEPAKVMKLGGWKDLKTLMIYLRLAGIDIQGALKNFDFFRPSETGVVLQLQQKN